jgi:hypothetical protein
MGAMTLTPTSDKKGGDSGPAVAPNPFTRGAREHAEPFADVSTAMVAASSTQVGPIDVAAFGFLRCIVLLVTCSGGTGAAGTLREDAPWTILDNIQLTDVNGAPIVGPLSGFDLFLANKWGGYTHDTDPANSPSYTVADTNNPAFLLRIPVEVTAWDGCGSLPNMSAAQAYKLSYTVSAASTVYSVNPGTTLPTVRVKAFIEAWTQPTPYDLAGVPNTTQPPAMGTTQYWTKTVVNITSGDQRVRLTRVGNLMRNVLLVFRNATPVRATTTFPDPLRVEWDGKIMHNVSRDLLRQWARERNQITPETGVFPLQFTHDADGKAGNENRNLYWPTTQASRIELVGNFGASGTLTILTNDVAPAPAV